MLINFFNSITKIASSITYDKKKKKKRKRKSLKKKEEATIDPN